MFSGIAAMAAGVARLKARRDALALEKERKAELRREALEALKRGGPEALGRWAKSRGVVLERAKKGGAMEVKPGPWSEDPDESKKPSEATALGGLMAGMSPAEALAALDDLESRLDRVSGRSAAERAREGAGGGAPEGEGPEAQAAPKRKILGARRSG